MRDITMKTKKKCSIRQADGAITLGIIISLSELRLLIASLQHLVKASFPVAKQNLNAMVILWKMQHILKFWLTLAKHPWNLSLPEKVMTKRLVLCS